MAQRQALRSDKYEYDRTFYGSGCIQIFFLPFSLSISKRIKRRLTTVILVLTCFGPVSSNAGEKQGKGKRERESND